MPPTAHDDEDAGPVVRPFADWLREDARGATHTELSEQLRQLAESVTTTGKRGHINLKVTLAPSGIGTVIVESAVTVKLPEHDKPTSFFYVDEDHNLVRNDPNQDDLYSGIESADRRAAREAGGAR